MSATNSSGANLNDSPEGVKHKDVLNNEFAPTLETILIRHAALAS